MNCQCTYCKAKKMRAYESALHQIMKVTETSKAHTDAAKAYHIAYKAIKGE